MLNHDKRYIFVHLRKTAGSTVTKILGDRETEEEKHFGPREYCERYGDACWSDYTTFTVIRNPFDVLVSDYSFSRHRRLEANSELKKHRHAVEWTFPKWLKRYHVGMFKPLRSKDGKIRFRGNEVEIDGRVYTFDLVARHEQLAHDLGPLSFFDTAKLDEVHRNRIERAHYSTFYGPDERAFVESEYGALLDSLGYAFETP